MGQCISAGCASVPAGQGYQLYSVLGTFLGPGTLNILTTFKVEDIRTTRSFATRKVEAWQDVPSSSQQQGKKGNSSGRRRIMIMLLDFSKPEQRSIFDYSVRPLYAISQSSDHTMLPFLDNVKQTYSHPDHLITMSEYILKTPNLGEKVLEKYRTTFPLFDKHFETRPVTTSMGVQKALGLGGKATAAQFSQGADLTRRTNSGWFRLKDSTTENQRRQPQRGLHEGALAFFMDGALAFLPLTFTNRFLNDAQACSTLEFSLRYFNLPDDPIAAEKNGTGVLDDWLLQEQSTEVGSQGRTFSTGRCWNTQGKMVAVMTQVGIMRPWSEEVEQAKQQIGQTKSSRL